MNLDTLLHTPIERLPHDTQRLRAEILHAQDHISEASKMAGTRRGLAVGGMVGASSAFLSTILAQKTALKTDGPVADLTREWRA